MMKALVKKQPGPGITMEQVALPQMGDDQVLIKVRKSAICGTDIHIYKWDAWAQKTIPYTPMIIGHEFMGEIVDLGRNVKNLKVGDRVCGEGHITCGQCPPCRRGQKHLCMNVYGVGYDCPGNFAEFFALPAENVFVLPDTVSDDLAAIFDPYGNAVHTALAFNLTAEDVLITGAGPIGIMAVAIAKHAGARNVVITDINDYRLDLARKMGATAAINVSKVSLEKERERLGIPHGFTVGMEMSGNQKGFSSLLENMQHGGKVALLGILPPNTGIDWDIVVFRMLTLKGIYGREIFNTWTQMVHLLEGGLDLAPVITHHFPIDQYAKGFEVMLSGQCGKVILDWE